ncbi:MAG: MFS transporter [Hyphomicrobiaceae bacterium]
MQTPQGTPAPQASATVDPYSRTRFPVWPLTATLAVQTFATAAAYSIPAVAPEVARHVGVPPALVGVFISMVYGVGILSAILSPAVIYTRGAVRVCQAVCLATLAMLATSSLGSTAAIAISACLMGLAYGATAPSSTHLLVPLTPPAHMNVVLSLRQIGVPLGGMLAGLVMPPLALRFGWQTSLLIQLIPTFALMVLLETVRRKWDARSPTAGPHAPSLRSMLGLLSHSAALRRLSFAAFV